MNRRYFLGIISTSIGTAVAAKIDPNGPIVQTNAGKIRGEVTRGRPRFAPVSARVASPATTRAASQPTSAASDEQTVVAIITDESANVVEYLLDQGITHVGREPTLERIDRL